MRDIFSDRLAKKSFCFCLGTLLTMLMLACIPYRLHAQDDTDFQEIDILLNVNRLGATDIPALIRNEDLYLSVSDLFRFLKIKNSVSEHMDSISGFILETNDIFLIDKQSMEVHYKNQTNKLKPDDLFKSETALYLKSNLFGDLFALYCTFDFRALTASLDTKIDLPVFREMQQALMRNNIGKLKGEARVDSTIRQSHNLFKPGMLDWAVTSTQQSNGAEYNKLNLGTGAAFAGGSAELGLSYQTHQAFDLENQHFLWKYANNDVKGMRQALIGQINANLISSIYKSTIGVQLTNAPTTVRKSFGTYKFSDTTEPNWVVELYMNTILVDYTQADASGLFSFDIPMVYGTSSISLRFYGPWGEEQERKLNISIPFNFLPKKELEYTVSAGFVTDSLNSRLARGEFNYGLTSRITLGGGAEYLSSISSGTSIPFANASARIGSGFLLSGEYDHGVQSKATASYNVPSGMQVEMEYTLIKKGQKAINLNYTESRDFSLILPVQLNKKALFTRFALHQYLFPNATATTAQVTLSAQILGINNNLSFYELANDQRISKTYNTYSTFSQTYHLPVRFTLQYQTQYDWKQNTFTNLKAEINKPLLKNSYLTLTYEQDFKSNFKEAGIGFRTDFSFAQTSFSARRNNNRESTFTESALGSLFYDSSTRHTGSSNRSSVGKGGLVLITFLDLNGNECYDKGEPRIENKNLSINGGRVHCDERDTVTRITDLEPYRYYTIEINRNGFDNIAWQLRNATLRIHIDPNILKKVMIPVYIAGEISGMVYSADASGQKGLGRIRVQITDKKGTVIASPLSEEDGYYNYFGLRPGQYCAQIDTLQMQKIHMVAVPENRPFTINASSEGDYKDGIDFTLRPVGETPTKAVAPEENKDLKKVLSEQKENYFVQIAAFKRAANATRIVKKCLALIPYPIILVKEKGLYKIRAGYFKTLAETDQCYQWIRSKHIKAIKGILIDGKPPFVKI